MIQRMRQAQDRLVREVWERRNPDLPLKTPEQLVILASIIEKETGKPEERTRVAAVFANRLKQKMKLQSDPTIIYGLVFGKGALGHPLTKSEIAQPTPVQHLRHRRPAARADRQSGPRLDRGRGQSGAHQGALLRRPTAPAGMRSPRPTISTSRTSRACALIEHERARRRLPMRKRRRQARAAPAPRSGASAARTARHGRPARRNSARIAGTLRLL